MIIGRAIMALPIIFVAVLNFDSPYYRSADSPILPYAVSLFRVREKEREGDAAGALHHIIARGITRGKIFKVCEILQLKSTELWAPGKHEVYFVIGPAGSWRSVWQRFAGS